jgi:hypothetical protein
LQQFFFTARARMGDIPKQLFHAVSLFTRNRVSSFRIFWQTPRS